MALQLVLDAVRQRWTVELDGRGIHALRFTAMDGQVFNDPVIVRPGYEDTWEDLLSEVKPELQEPIRFDVVIEV